MLLNRNSILNSRNKIHKVRWRHVSSYFTLNGNQIKWDLHHFNVRFRDLLLYHTAMRTLVWFSRLRRSHYTFVLSLNVLKGRYTFGNCQRPVFSLDKSNHNHKITSLWKFWLNWSSKLRENDERKNTIVMAELVCFQIRIKDVFIYFSEKLPISQKLRYFRGSRFP